MTDNRLQFIHITIQPGDEMRYPTAGDYLGQRHGLRVIEVAQQRQTEWELMIAIHELIKQHLVLQAGISIADIDKWDMEHLEESDPGSLPGCPYLNAHLKAESVERVAAAALGVDWEEYINNIVIGGKA